jgi:cytochrome P450
MPVIENDPVAILNYDPFDYRTQDDPYPIYRRLRDESPVFHNTTHDFYALSRYEDVQSAVRDFKTYTSAQGTSLEELKAQVDYLINTDPPVHTRLRHLISGLFTPAKVAPLENAVRDMARDLLAPHLKTGKIDILSEFAARLPMAIICRLLGFRPEDEDQLRHWTDTVVHRDEGVFSMPDAGMEATLKLYEYFNAEIAARAQGASREDIVGLLVDAKDAGKIDNDGLLGYIYILSIAGNETTTKLIGNICYQLHRHPDQFAEVLADRSLIPQLVEETMRFDGPTQMMARTTTRDVELHGKTIPAGKKVALIFTSGNRDERHYVEAEAFDIHRKARDHLGFGGGLHACLGAALARLEACVAMEEILDALGHFTVDETGLQRMHSPNVRGFTHVPLSFSASSGDRR